MSMTEKEIGNFYKSLKSGEKDKFTAYMSIKLGGSPHSWQQKFLLWSKDDSYRPAIRIILSKITQIIASGCWNI